MFNLSKITTENGDKWILALTGFAIGLLAMLFLYSFFPQKQLINFNTSTVPSYNDVVKVQMSRSIASNASANGETYVFNSKVDRNIYMVLDLKNSKNTDVFTYVRYYNNNFIDSMQATVGTSGVPYFYFNWNKSGGLDYPTGSYMIKVYENGNYVDSVAYSVV